MTISVLDVRDTFASPHIRVPARPAVASKPLAPRRLPLTVLAAGLIGIVEALAILAVAITQLDGVLASPARPAGWIVAAGLLALAGWVVLAAGSGVTLMEGHGRRMLLGVCYAEMTLVAAVLVAATMHPLVPATPLPLPAMGLLALAVPVGKLLLAGAPSAVAWIAAGPRVREQRVDPVHAHRVLATLTLAVIGLSLGALAVLTPVQDGGAGAGSTISSVTVFQG